MPLFQLIADSGATKTTWILLGGARKKTISTQGISPYFLTSDQIAELLKAELLPRLPQKEIAAVHFYGTGCANAVNRKLVETGIRNALPSVSTVNVESDLLGAARALCGVQEGVVGILGTGSNSCVFNGKIIKKNNPAPGYVLGDEGSGAYLGKKVLQYFIYNTFDEDLMHKFKTRYQISYTDILHHVYKEPWPNRYLAGFAPFLSENRGHYMIENIIEDGLSDFFQTHLYKYTESWTLPLHFSGSIAWHFKDVLKDLCSSFELQLGRVLKNPMEGLLEYHSME